MEKEVKIFEIPMDLPEKFNTMVQERLMSYGKLAAVIDFDPIYLSQALRKKKPFSEKMRRKLNAFFETDY